MPLCIVQLGVPEKPVEIEEDDEPSVEMTTCWLSVLLASTKNITT